VNLIEFHKHIDNLNSIIDSMIHDTVICRCRDCGEELPFLVDTESGDLLVDPCDFCMGRSQELGETIGYGEAREDFNRPPFPRS